jgi:hypothetical protein
MPFAGESAQTGFRPTYGNYVDRVVPASGGQVFAGQLAVSQNDLRPSIRDPIRRMYQKAKAAQREMDALHSGFRTINAQAKQAITQTRKYREWTARLPVNKTAAVCAGFKRIWNGRTKH